MQSSEGMPCFLDINQTGKMNHVKDERAADYRITQQLSSGRHLWKSPKLYSEQSQLNQIAQGHVHSSSEHHQWWSLHHIYGQPALVSDHSHNVIKNKGVSLPLQSEALPHALSLTTPERSLSASFTIEKIPKTFSSLRCAVPACSASPHSTSTPNTWWLWWPLAGLPAEHPCLKLRSPEVDTALQRKSRPAGKALPRAAPEAFGSKRTLLAHGQHGVHQDPPKPFAQSCFPVAQPCSLRSSQLSSFYFKMQQ